MQRLRLLCCDLDCYTRRILSMQKNLLGLSLGRESYDAVGTRQSGTAAVDTERRRGVAEANTAAAHCRPRRRRRSARLPALALQPRITSILCRCRRRRSIQSTVLRHISLSHRHHRYIDFSHYFTVITSTPAGVRSIAISVCVSVCLSICLSARISPKPHVQISRNFLCILPVAVA